MLIINWNSKRITCLPLMVKACLWLPGLCWNFHYCLVCLDSRKYPRPLSGALKEFSICITDGKECLRSLSFISGGELLICYAWFKKAKPTLLKHSSRHLTICVLVVLICFLFFLYWGPDFNLFPVKGFDCFLSQEEYFLLFILLLAHEFWRLEHESVYWFHFTNVTRIEEAMPVSFLLIGWY